MKTGLPTLTQYGAAWLAFCLSAGSTFAQSNFHFPGSYNSQGLPAYLEPQSDVIDTGLTKNIERALPERKPVPQYHPEYIAGQAETEVKLYAEADVWVTFVGEMAGWKNSLGFYTYNLNNPPQTSQEIANKTIIFPNVSAPGSSGALVPGSKVKIGHFAANTGVGWFLIADGWRNSAVTEGNYFLYSNSKFNPEPNVAERSHTVLLNDNRNRLILGFEDTRRDQNSDNDFNDVLFYITANPFTAIQKDNIVVITPAPSPVPNPNPAPNPTGTTVPTPSATNPSTPVANTTYHTTNTNTTNNNTPTSNSNNVTSSSNTTNTTNTTTTSNSNNATTNSNNATTNSNNATTNSNNTNSNNVTTNNTTIINNNTTVAGNDNRGNGRSRGQHTNPASTPASGQSNSPRPSSGSTTPAPTPTSTTCGANGFSPSDFTKTTALIRNKPNEDVRVSTTKQAVRGKLLTVDQCTKLINLLTVSAHQLDMAKYLFDYTCEKSNYFMVSQTLKVASYEREFNAFLSTKHIPSPTNTNESTPTRPRSQSDRPSESYSNTPRNSTSTGTDNATNTNVNTTNVYVVTDGNASYSNRPSGSGENGYSGLCNNGFTDADFASLQNSVRKQSFSDTKLTIIQQAIRNRTLTTSQDTELVSMLSFEQDKLKLAKLLYDSTCDKQNFYKINSVFTFSTTIDELNEFLNRKN